MPGKYRAYPEYKKSDADMLGEIPSHWHARQVRFLLKDGAEGIKIGPFGSALKLEDMVESGFRVYGQENVIKKDFALGKRLISKAKFEEMQVYQIYANDLLITMMGTSGKCELVPEDIEAGIIDSHLLRLRVDESKIIPRFFRLLIDECYEIEQQIKIAGKGSIMHGLNSSIVKSLQVPLPTREDQKYILAFLDHETAKIDTLIEKQQQLIKLLKEKRQAVISHAVTKGLNPKAKMKDSGVEWLGEVPEHWVVCRLKQVIKSGSSISYGIVQPGDPLDDGIPFVQTTNMSKGTFDLDELQKTTKEIAMAYPRSTLEGGEVILGIRASIGAAYVVPEKLKGVNLSRGVARIIPDVSILSDYLVMYFGTGAVERYWGLSKQGSTFSEVSIETVREMWLVIPPLDEQKKICASVKKIAESLDGIIEMAMQQTSLLQERRTALISAAVTGKIDVRNWVAPKESKTNKEIAA